MFTPEDHLLIGQVPTLLEKLRYLRFQQICQPQTPGLEIQIARTRRELHTARQMAASYRLSQWSSKKFEVFEISTTS